MNFHFLSAITFAQPSRDATTGRKRYARISQGGEATKTPAGNVNYRRHFIFYSTVFTVLAVSASFAYAHDFYPRECCHDQDCRPAKAGELVRSPEGYRWHSITIPYGDDRIRYSPDGREHICICQSYTSCEPGEILCVFVKGEGA